MKVTSVLVFLLLGLLASAQQMEVRVDGAVSFDGATFAVTEAGEDFAFGVESESSLWISVDTNDYWDKKVNPNRKWWVEVVREDLTWNDDVRLEIVRTGDGYGQKNNHKVYDGTTYQYIGENSWYFFRGRGIIYDIPIQLRLSGLSVTQGAQDFETNVILTIYDD